MIKSYFTVLTLALTFLCKVAVSQPTDPDGTKNYMLEDWSSGTIFLEKFKETNWEQWKHAAARIDGFMFRRNSVPGITEIRNANNETWQGFKALVTNSVWYAGMNSGLMNKSYEYADRSKWSNRFSGDLSIIRSCKEAGFQKIVMYMQSPLSKGQKPDFDPNHVDETQPNGGASLEQRVLDCLEYAQYIDANKADGIEVTYALIDAFPQKNIWGDRSIYRAAFKDLAIKFRDAGLTFEGIIFDGKTDWVKNNGAKILCEDCRYVAETIASEVGTPLYAGWYTWNKVNTPEQGDAAYEAAINKIKADVNGNWLTHFWIAGNKEQGHFPDYIDGTPSTRTERVNQAFCWFEGYENNPTQFGDEILGPINSSDIPPSAFKSFSIEINTVNKLTLNWSNVYREENYIVKRFTNSRTTDTVEVATLAPDAQTYVDETVYPDSTYIYFISAENEFGRTFSEEIEVTISTTVPAAATNITTDTSSCYEIAVSWDDNADNENNYILIRKEIGVDDDSVQVLLDANTNAYNDFSVSAGTAYKYQIAGLNHIGTSYSVWKEASNAACIGAPAVPDSLEGIANLCRMTDFSWNDTSINETGFELRVGIKDGDWESYYLGRNIESFSAKLDFDTVYKASIRSYNAADTSDWSDTITVNIPECDCQRSTYGNNGEPWEIGDYVQVENFDQCLNRQGQFITYYESENEKKGDLSIRPNELIALFVTVTATEGDEIIRSGGVGSGEYYEYTFNVENSGTYEIEFRLASKDLSVMRRIEVYSGEEFVTSLDYESTSDVNWKFYKKFLTDDFELQAGEQIIRIVCVSGGNDMDWFRILPVGTIGVNELQNDAITLYPNPAKSTITITGISQATTISMYALHGRLVKQVSVLNDETISTNDLDNGMYIIEIRQGNNKTVKKLMIQK